MKRFKLLLLLASSALSQQSYADHLSSRYLFAAKLDGAQEVPAVTTNALGLATLFLNDARDTMCVRVVVNGLSGPITGAHIHEAPMGTNGGVVINLGPYLSGNSISATLTGAMLTDTTIMKMLNGDYYVNVHTAANPNGEIRGQIMPETDWGIMVQLNGNQEVPPVATGGEGLGFFMLSKHMDRLSFNVLFDGLTGPVTGAHLHYGGMGQSGPVVENLAIFQVGNLIAGSVDTISAYIQALMMDSIYINIHTAANPGGEIRGQLKLMPRIYYNALLNGVQEVPPVSTLANGVAVFELNYTFDTLWYHIMVEGLSGAINAAHLHKGELGVGGGVFLGFPGSSIVNNMITGYFTGAQITDSLLRYLNTGSLYVNVHTTANPAGEIRGQVYRTFREGYTFNITGDQEDPPVTTNAYGLGMVSIDRDENNAHYMMVVNGISPVAAHFHRAAPGFSGPVIFDLGPVANNGVFGYWKQEDPTTPFGPPVGLLFRQDSVYANFHTTAHPNGEIRGNVNRMLCNPMIMGVANIPGLVRSSTLYPNPASEQATLSLELEKQADVSVELADVMGRKVWMTNKALQSGHNRFVIPLEGLAPGLYSVKVSTTTGTQSFKLVKK